MNDAVNKMKDEILEDMRLDEENFMEKSLRVPMIFSKWLERFIKAKAKYMEIKTDLDRIYGERYEYYKTEYVRELKISEIEAYILKDPIYIEKLREYNNIKLYVEFLTSIMETVRGLSFNIKNYIEAKKFYSGA